MPDYSNGIENLPIMRDPLPCNHFVGLRQWGINPEPWRKCTFCGWSRTEHLNRSQRKTCSYCDGTGLEPQ